MPSKEIAQTLIDIVGFLGRIRYLSDHSNPPSVGFDTRLLEATIGDRDRLLLAEGLRREIDCVFAAERESTALPGPV